MIPIIKNKGYSHKGTGICKFLGGKKMYIIFITLAVLLLVMTYIYFDLNFTKVQYVNIETDKLQGRNEFKILQISDFHDSKSKIIWNRILRSINETKPDIIVMTGDIISSTTRDLSNAKKFAGEIANICPDIYFISGNHEWRSGYNTSFINELKSMGIIVLNNTNRIITTGGSEINICGIDDYYTRSYDMDRAFYKTNGRNFTILLSHAPDIIFRYGNIPADLMLCGHTHGGQVRLPFIGALMAPGQGFLPKYDKGLFKLDNGTLLYIDSGIGTSVLPIRFFNRSQISLITVKNR